MQRLTITPVRRWQEHYHEVARPSDWIPRANRPQSKAELEALRTAISRGQPFGSEDWQKRTARQLGLEGSFRSRGRPKKVEAKGKEK